MTYMTDTEIGVFRVNKKRDYIWQKWAFRVHKKRDYMTEMRILCEQEKRVCARNEYCVWIRKDTIVLEWSCWSSHLISSQFSSLPLEHKAAPEQISSSQTRFSASRLSSFPVQVFPTSVTSSSKVFFSRCPPCRQPLLLFLHVVSTSERHVEDHFRSCGEHSQPISTWVFFPPHQCCPCWYVQRFPCYFRCMYMSMVRYGLLCIG